MGGWGGVGGRGGGRAPQYLPVDNTIGWWNSHEGIDINELYSPVVTRKDNLQNNGACLKWSKNKLYP